MLYDAIILPLLVELVAGWFLSSDNCLQMTSSEVASAKIVLKATAFSVAKIVFLKSNIFPLFDQ